MSTALNTVLLVTDVHKSYQTREGNLDVLKGISLTLKRGEMLGIVGVSGSGKSTLFRLIAGIEEIDCGGIHIDDRESLQLISQDPREAFSPRMQMIDFFLSAFDCPNKEARAQVLNRVEEILAEVELKPSMLNALPHQLSGGELQRIIIARTLLLKPQVLLFDEPTSALDVLTQKHIVELISKLRKRYAFAGIFVSHDLAAVQAAVDRLLVLYRGEFVEELAASEILAAKHEHTKELIKAQLFS